MNVAEIIIAAATFLALLGQTGALFYWGGKINAHVEVQGQRLENIERKIDSHIASHREA